MKPKSTCCEKYERKPKLCKDCPLAIGLKKKRRRKLARKLRKRLRAA